MSIVLLLAVLFVQPVRDRVFSMFAGRGDSSNNFRINVWFSVIQMIQDHPILASVGKQRFQQNLSPIPATSF
jgi:putative inorganic carbon (HCO3(-)) transporter